MTGLYIALGVVVAGFIVKAGLYFWARKKNRSYEGGENDD